MDKRGEFLVEHFIFHRLVRRYRRKEVEWVYLAVQAGLAFEQPEIDVGETIRAILPQGYTYPSAYCPALGPDDLAFFHFLFDVALVEPGATDSHTYRFARRYDGASVLVVLKTDMSPESPGFRDAYRQQVAKLQKSREDILAKERWFTFDEYLGIRDVRRDCTD